MKSELEDLSPSRKRLLIEATWDEVRDDYSDVLKEFAKANVPGFRPGRAPRDVIEQRYARDIEEEVSNRCARRLWREALAQHDLGMIGVAELYDMKLVRDEGISFKGECDVVPEFELPPYAGIALSKDADENARRDEISRYLLENTKFDLPESFVEREVGGEEKDAPDYEEMRQAAAARVKLMIILKRIAHQDGIEVDDRDIDERIAAIAEAQGAKPNLLRNELATKGGLGRLKDLLLAEMVLDYIMERSAE